MPFAPLNGQLHCSDSNRVSSVCSFVCNEGYELRGTERVDCQSGGTWSSTFPTCHQSKAFFANDVFNHRFENGKKILKNNMMKTHSGASLILK